jgi:hypothetical protein
MTCGAASECKSGACDNNLCVPNTETCGGDVLPQPPGSRRRRLSTKDALLINSMSKWKELASDHIQGTLLNSIKNGGNQNYDLNDALKLSMDHLLGNITMYEQHPNNRRARR